MKIQYYLLCFAFILFFIGCDNKNQTHKQAYPTYTLSNFDGKKIEIIKYKNKIELIPTPQSKKPVMFFFIQPSCTECFKGIEHIKRVYEDYQNKILFFAIISDTQSNEENFKSEVAILKKNYGLNFEFYRSIGEDFLQSFEREGNSNLIVLYNSSFSLVEEYEGLVAEEMLELDLNLLIK